MSGKNTTIKNRAPAPIQITAEQILREAHDRGIESIAKAPKQFITDREELTFYQQGKRKDFEDQLQRQRSNIGVWCKYALWEASQLDFERARSVFERALDVDYRNPTIWLKYAEMEMKNKFINHARNVWDRCVTLLPRVDSFWYKYSYMEEMLGAIDNARHIFERWMAWEPDDLAWAAYIKFEMRQNQKEKARELYERYIKLWPTSRAYLKYARWEEEQKERSLARRIYERALVELHPQEKKEKLILSFARFEERCKEFDRARVIYQYAMENCSQLNLTGDLEELKLEYLAFERRHGDREGVENVLMAQQREKYEKSLEIDPFNYDLWFDYLRMEEIDTDFEQIRNLYERSVRQVPILKEKLYWKRYIYLWINYAVFEELTAKNFERARDIYKRCLDIIPHKTFTFGKIWILAAQLEVRNHNLGEARKILGRAIGLCGKRNIFKGYIDLELQLGEMERCRVIYSKFVATLPYLCEAWQSFAQLEINLGEISRARAIFEIALSQSELDMPELIWKAYIDFELAEDEFTLAEQLYERLLQRSSHVKVWIAYARTCFERFRFCKEKEISEEGSFTEKSRLIFSNGLEFKHQSISYDALRKEGLNEERVLLLEAWRDMEIEALQHSLPGSGKGFIDRVDAKFPKKVSHNRNQNEEPSYDLIFPDDENNQVGIKLLEKALAWKNALSAVNQEKDSSLSTSLGKRSHENQISETIDIDF